MNKPCIYVTTLNASQEKNVKKSSLFYVAYLVEDNYNTTTNIQLEWYELIDGQKGSKFAKDDKGETLKYKS